MAALHRLVDATDQVKLDDIVRESELERKQVSNACDKLVTHGYLFRQTYSDGKVKPGKFRLTNEGRIALEAGANLKSGPKGPSGKPRNTAGSLREKVWRLLRIQMCIRDRWTVVRVPGVAARNASRAAGVRAADMAIPGKSRRAAARRREMCIRDRTSGRSWRPRRR